ncbi:bacterial mobilization protein MobC [Gottschalkia purinilytica]|uniref:Bacterial mobilization protein MobC n=1 Tax=Gottschalkia purinilytica TaxID=1503 RepID=A0A0L0WDG0_GOTPU|nr:bacterial mobilization protein MobC [Gottschalkia purinilytica]
MCTYFHIFYPPASCPAFEKLIVGKCPKPSEKKRKRQLKFYVTEWERALIEEKMKLLGTKNIGVYLQKMAIDGYIIQVDYSPIKEQAAEIQKIDVNVNQIAKHINAIGNIDEQGIKEIKGR